MFDMKLPPRTDDCDSVVGMNLDCLVGMHLPTCLPTYLPTYLPTVSVIDALL